MKYLAKYQDSAGTDKCDGQILDCVAKPTQLASTDLRLSVRIRTLVEEVSLLFRTEKPILPILARVLRR
jgi:hypothetical protein